MSHLVGVTRRKHRHESVPVGQKTVTSWTLTELKASVMGCKEGEPVPQELGACGSALFAIRVQFLLSITRVGPAPLLQIKSGVQV